jgi:Protein of unknown function (DUF2865)
MGRNHKMARWRKQAKLRAVGLCSLFAALAIASGPAQAGGFFDFLFGGPDKGPHPSVSSYADPSAPVTPPTPLGQESVRQNSGSTGHGVAFCVRLCDGQHFPLEQRVANATPVETCRSMCPASKTKVYFGSEIDHAVAQDGGHYADLATAYIYRKQLVANCTCNGKDALGLAHYDLPTDPTLRPGDIVATKKGLMAYNGSKDPASQYTPVSVPSVATQLNSVTSAKSALNRHDVETVEDDPGTIAQSQPPSPPPLNVGAEQSPVNLRWPSIQ